LAINIIKRIKNEGLVNEIKRLRVKSYFFFFKLTNKNLTKSGYLKSFYGPFLLENWNDITFRFCLRGSYGVYFSNFLKKINNEFIFFDIGANQGLYSLIAATNKKCSKTFSFEPVKKTVEIFKKNINRNGLSKKIRVIEYAVDSIQSDKRKIQIDPSHSGSASLSKGVNFSSYEFIKTVNRKFIQKLNLPHNAEIIIKIDVEGNEINVLNELVNLEFFDRVSVIYFEYDESSIDSEKILTFMKKNKFKIHHLKDSASHTQYNIFALKENLINHISI